MQRFFGTFTRRHENLLISHENLLSFAHASPDKDASKRSYGTVPNVLEKLVESRAFSRIVLILYIRRQDHHLESMFIEEIKQGLFVHSFAGYLGFRRREEVSWLGLVQAFERWG